MSEEAGLLRHDAEFRSQEVFFLGSRANFPLEIAGKKREVPTYAHVKIGGAVLGGIVMAWQAGRAAEPASADAFESRRTGLPISRCSYRVPGFEQLPSATKTTGLLSHGGGLFRARYFLGPEISSQPRRPQNARDDPAQLSRPNAPGTIGTRFWFTPKQVFFANGIHHHYGSAKMLPAFPESYLATLLAHADAAQLPLQGKSVAGFHERAHADPLRPEARRENGQPRRRRR